MFSDEESEPSSSELSFLSDSSNFLSDEDTGEDTEIEHYKKKYKTKVSIIITFRILNKKKFLE